MAFGGFGVSAGDLVAVGTLAWRIYKACKNASVEFEEVSHEVVALHTPIKVLEDEARDPNSILRRAGADKDRELQELLNNCKLVLRHLEGLLFKYKRLGTQSRRTWDRLKFGREGLEEVREKLTFHASAINLFLTSLGTATLGRVERKIEELVKEIREGKRAPTILSFSDEENPAEAEQQWDALKKELLEEGITKPELEAHKFTIRLKLQQAMDSSEMPRRYRDTDSPDKARYSRQSVTGRYPSPNRGQASLLEVSSAQPEPYQNVLNPFSGQQSNTTVKNVGSTIESNPSLQDYPAQQDSSRRRSDARWDEHPNRKRKHSQSRYFGSLGERRPFDRSESEMSDYHEETTEYDGSGQVLRHTVTRRSSTSRTVDSSPIQSSNGVIGRPSTPFLLQPNPRAFAPSTYLHSPHPQRPIGAGSVLNEVVTNRTVATQEDDLPKSHDTFARNARERKGTLAVLGRGLVNPQDTKFQEVSKNQLSFAEKCIASLEGANEALKKENTKLKAENEQLNVCYREAWSRGDFYCHERNRYRATVQEYHLEAAITASRTPPWPACRQKLTSSPVPTKSEIAPMWFHAFHQATQIQKHS